MELKINEVAKLCSITVRTLHYYDELGLLHPSKISHAGYRLYTHSDLERLQHILFFRELDFPLGEIKQIVTNPNFDKTQALNAHKQLLVKKRQRLDDLISLVEKTIKGDNTMSFDEFDTSEIQACKESYAAEAKKRWGNTDAYAQSRQKTSGYTAEQWVDIDQQSQIIFKAFADSRHLPPQSDTVQALVRTWQDYITNNFYTCTKEILAGLGLMYTQDERFKNNIDQFGADTAQHMSQAIKFYCEQ